MRNLETALRDRWLDLSIAASLFLVVLGVYAPVRHYGFVDYDDYFYVSQNPHVLSGLNAGSLRWAFTSTEFANWFPLTWISLMADRQFFAAPEEMLPSDVRAGAIHRTNVMLHAAATLLLFALLKRTTGAAASTPEPPTMGMARTEVKRSRARSSPGMSQGVRSRRTALLCATATGDDAGTRKPSTAIRLPN